jgi:hypothetical protein
MNGNGSKASEPTIMSKIEEETCQMGKRNKEITEPKEMKSAATLIVEAVRNEDSGLTELWHTSEGGCYISVCFNDGHVEHKSLKAKSTKQWIAGSYFDQTNKVANSSAISSAIVVLEGYAMNGPTYTTYTRVAEVEEEGEIYIDLGDKTWDAIRITQEGWDVVRNPPVKFQRNKGLKPLPRPEKSGSIDDLRSILNIEKDDQWLLVKGWLLGTISPNGPYAILAVGGEQGSAKTWLGKILRSIIDPNALASRRPPKNTEDLMIAANNNWIVSFDNLSKITPKMSDDLCNLATGGGLSKRELYSDSDETIIHVCRPMIVNGIEDVVTRQDLLDRAIYISMPTIPKEKRLPEKSLLKQFNQMHPKILGALLDAAVVGLQRRDTIEVSGLPRMADFALWVMSALGDQGPEFLAAYMANRDNAVKDALDDNPVAMSLIGFMDLKEGGEWSGTATELLRLLDTMTGYAVRRPPQGWPRAPNALSGILKRLKPGLPKMGIRVEFGRDESIKSRVITLTKVGIEE